MTLVGPNNLVLQNFNIRLYGCQQSTLTFPLLDLYCTLPFHYMQWFLHAEISFIKNNTLEIKGHVLLWPINNILMTPFSAMIRVRFYFRNKRNIEKVECKEHGEDRLIGN